MQEERRSTLHSQAQALPPLRRAAEQGAGWTGYVPVVTSPTGRAGSPCDDRPAAGQAWPGPGPASTGLPTREEEKKIKRTAGKDRDRGPAVVNRGMGALARSPRRAENRRARDKRQECQ